MSNAPYASALPPRPAMSAEEKTLPIVVYVLYLLGFLTAGFTALIGVIMAYVLKAGAGPLAASHYRFQIRTFWVALLWLAIGGFVALLGIPLLLALGLGVLFLLAAKLIFLATAVYWGVRSVVGLIRAAQDEAYPTPGAWLL